MPNGKETFVYWVELQENEGDIRNEELDLLG